jgi:hypothetical protein
MINLSGVDGDAMAAVIADWRRIVDEFDIRQSPAYQFHRGKPVVGVWGVGFGDDRPYTLAATRLLLEQLRDNSKYGGNCVVVGVPNGWLRQRSTVTFADERDATNATELAGVLKLADVISP